jgi:hypothetical protein
VQFIPDYEPIATSVADCFDVNAGAFQLFTQVTQRDFETEIHAIRRRPAVRIVGVHRIENAFRFDGVPLAAPDRAQNARLVIAYLEVVDHDF